MANTMGPMGSKGRGFKPPRAEDDAINPKTRRPHWDESAPDAKDPGRTAMRDTLAATRKLGPGKPTNTTSTGRKPNNYDVFIAQRKKAGTKGY